MKFLIALLILIFPLFSFAVPFESQKFSIAAPSPWAVKAAEATFKKGGNVADMAVAAALTLSVTSPYYAALGGGGFALIKMKNEVEALDFRETAPAATNANYYSEKEKGASETGGTAVGVPGVPAGLVAIHKKYGKLKWNQLFGTALSLAQKGMPLSGEWIRYTREEDKRFTAAAKRYFTKTPEAYAPGDEFKQTALARALTILRDQGAKGFYEGPVAQDLVASVKNAKGEMSLEDLKKYRVRWLKPLQMNYSGYTVHMMPPPSSGGIVMMSALKLFELGKLNEITPQSGDEYHFIGEILKRAFRGRTLLGDPDFANNPIAQLTSETYLKQQLKEISASKAKDVEPVDLNSFDSTETTHFSIMTANGDAIAFTVTLNGAYGSGVVSERFGIALNNEMDDFTTKPGEPNQFGLIQGDANKVEAGKRPLSSMSPTIVEKDGKTELVLGSPGGPRIISAVTQVLYRFLITKMNIDAAIQAPRVHHQTLPNKLFIDPLRFQHETKEFLKRKGHVVEESPVAKVYGVAKHPSGWMQSAFDSRGEGAAGGL
ncbi:MAG: gamma-glutamyltransferase [Bdellovibrionales bacterium]